MVEPPLPPRRLACPLCSAPRVRPSRKCARCDVRVRCGSCGDKAVLGHWQCIVCNIPWILCEHAETRQGKPPTPRKKRVKPGRFKPHCKKLFSAAVEPLSVKRPLHWTMPLVNVVRKVPRLAERFAEYTLSTPAHRLLLSENDPHGDVEPEDDISCASTFHRMLVSVPAW